MKKQNIVISRSVEIGVFPGNSGTVQPFSHFLKGLLVQTEVLKANVISMQLYLSGQPGQISRALFLSDFHIELVCQSISLQYQIACFGETSALKQEWQCYGDLWRVSDMPDVSKTLTQLANATDNLTVSYESILPISANQADQSTSFFLLAGHLSVLNTFYASLQNFANKQD